MRNNRIKKLISQLVMISLIFGLVCGIAPAPIKAKAATGAWTFTSEGVGICVGYKSDSNSEYHDLIRGDGSSEVKSSTKSPDGYQARTYAYQGKGDRGVKFMESGGYVGPGDNHTSENYSECTIPATSYAAGATVTLQIHTWTNNMVGHGLATRRVASIGTSGAGFTGSHGECLQDADGKTQFDQNSTNPNTSKWFKFIKGEATITVTGTMPKEPREGDTCTIYYITDGGQYEWNYTYKVTEDPAPTPAPVSVKKPGKVTITSLKNKKKGIIDIKLKINEKVSGYQVQCALNKKFKKPVTYIGAEKPKNVSKAKKGKTYYFRARAYNTKPDGTKLYGKWSATKKIKVKK